MLNTSASSQANMPNPPPFNGLSIAAYRGTTRQHATDTKIAASNATASRSVEDDIT